MYVFETAGTFLFSYSSVTFRIRGLRRRGTSARGLVFNTGKWKRSNNNRLIGYVGFVSCGSSSSPSVLRLSVCLFACLVLFVSSGS